MYLSLSSTLESVSEEYNSAVGMTKENEGYDGHIINLAPYDIASFKAIYLIKEKLENGGK